MAANSRRTANLNGATIGPLNQVAYVDSSKVLINAAIKSAPKDQKAVTNDILAAIKQMIYDSGKYQLKIDAKASDILMGRIASLLDEVKESFVKNELEDIKNDILNEISGLSIENVLKNFLLDQITELFDDDVKKEDIIELKKWMQQNLIASGKTASDQVIQPSNKTVEDEQQTKKQLEEEKDEEKGDFKDSTPANNFYTLYSFVQKQFDILNENMKNIPGQSGILSKTTAFIENGFLNTIKKISSIEKSMKSITSRIGKLGSGVGGMISTPFKKIGNLFSSFNPFKGKNDGKKRALRDKMMNVISNVINKIWTTLKPFVKIVTKFIWMAIKTIIIPIAIIVAKVLLIAAAITAIGIGLILAYFWIKKKIAGWIEYFKSGQWWEDLKAKILDAWEWLKDFGKWFGTLIWDGLLRWWKFIFVDIWVWLWDKLCEFGKWMYDNYIDKYLVQPFKQYIWEPVKKLWNEKIWPTIEPFVKSLIELKDKIIQAFSAWDISGIIIDAVVEWWDGSPFKEFYDKYLEPIVKSLGDLIVKIKTVWSNLQWDENKSFIDNLKDIGGILIDSIKEWWNASDNPIHETWNKVVNWFNDMTKPLEEWYNKSSLKNGIDNIINVVKKYVVDPLKGLSRKLMSFLVQLSNMSINLPTGIKTEKYVGLPVPVGFEWTPFYPLSGIKNKLSKDTIAQAEIDAEKSPAELIQEEMSKMQDTIDSATNPNVQYMPNDKTQMQSNQTAIQQVQQAMQPVQNIERMQTNDQKDLQNNGSEIASIVEQKEEDNSQFNEEQSMKTDKLIDMMNMFMPQILNKLDNPQKIPVVVPYQANYMANNANMQAY